MQQNRKSLFPYICIIMIIARHGDVILRELEETDIPKLAEYANNQKVSNNLRDAFPSPYTVEDARAFVAMARGRDPKSIFAIEYKGEYVGNISLMPCGDVYRNSAEIGYFIGEPFWNKGIMTTAVTLITAYGFDILGVVRIFTGIFEYNKASGCVLEKCGFEKEAVFKKAITKKGVLYDEVRYARIKS